MSTPPLITSSLDVSKLPRHGAKLPNWLLEPLLHFVVLGGLLFAVDHYLFTKADDPNTIVVTTEVDDEAVELYLRTHQRKPSVEEMDGLQRVWLDNEVLYREGLALQLDKGDTAIRDRVIFKALSAIDASLKLPPYDDKILRDWFEKHRVKYDEPQRYNFQEAVISGNDTSEATVRAFVATLNQNKSGEEASAGLRVFKDRPMATLEQSYGADFSKALDKAPLNEWQAQKTRDGWRAIRLESITTPKPAVYENLRGVILQDWTDATMADLRTAAVRALLKKYTVKFETIIPEPE